MKTYKEKLDNIAKDILKLEELKYTITRDASEDFNKRVTNWIGDGIYIKFKSDYGNRYGYVTKMESRVYKDRHNKIAVSSVNGKGIFLFESKTNGFTTCNPEFYGDFELIFTFLDNVEEITKDEFNERLTQWINVTEHDYLFDDEFEPEPDWFKTENYHWCFEKYRTIFNNSRLEEKFNEINN